MANIKISTDGTVQGTKLIVDGKECTAEEQVVSISLFANAPFKSKYSGENIPGSISCSYEYADDKGIVERRSVCSSDTAYAKGIGQEVESKDSVIRFMGREVDKEVGDLVDKIIAESTKLKAKCPTKEILLSRNLVSLKDKASDLGIKLEDAVAK